MMNQMESAETAMIEQVQISIEAVEPGRWVTEISEATEVVRDYLGDRADALTLERMNEDGDWLVSLTAAFWVEIEAAGFVEIESGEASRAYYIGIYAEAR